jgi:hypothetical protein
MAASLQILLRFEPFHHAITQRSLDSTRPVIFQYLSAMSDQLLSHRSVAPDPLIQLFSIDEHDPCDIVEFMYHLLNAVLQACDYDRDLASLFSFHFRTENDPENMLFCTFPADCKSTAEAMAELQRTQPSKFMHLPELLLIQISRATPGSSDEKYVKDPRPVAVSPELHLGTQDYVIYAAAQHYGATLANGHFVVYLRDRLERIFCNDSHIAQTTEARMTTSCLKT